MTITKLLGAAAIMALAAAPASAARLVLTDIGGVSSNAGALAGFNAAARFWETMLTNDVTVNLSIGFSSTGFSSPNVLGSTASTRYTTAATDTLQLLREGGNSRLDAIAAQNQPTLVNGAVSAITNAPRALIQTANGPLAVGANVNVREYDNDGSLNNTRLVSTAANLKALGFSGISGNDATIRFNSAFTFDFDPTDGIAGNTIDFVGVAVHEIGHALGFTSGVDTWDGNAARNVDFDGNALQSVLDLYRYSANPDILGGGGPKLDWSIGGNPYFSIDGGETIYDGGFFSTGVALGDGRQASHWKDNTYTQGPVGSGCLIASPPIGIMDPTFGRCEQGAVDSIDFAAFDAIGWNVAYDVLGTDVKFDTGSIFSGAFFGLVPESATWMQMIAGFGLVGAAARGRRREPAFG